VWSEPDAAIGTRATREMRATGLLGAAEVTDTAVVRLPRVYPVYARGFAAHVAAIVAHLATLRGLTAIGRGGAFKYNNQDHSILMGMLAVENIADGGQHDLWAVNSGDEYHEAGEIITASGLAPAS
jgi:protoporphyrinogen oxidase